MSNAPSPSWFVGTIGFSYPEWSQTLYAGLPSNGPRLPAYSRDFNAVEINTTFYGVPTAATIGKWADQTPPAFRFCMKMPRDVTHGPTPPGSLAGTNPPPDHLLRDSTLAAAQHFLQSLEPLRPKLGAVLMQFPPLMKVDHREALAAFLDRLAPAMPLAIEFRHDSWWSAGTAELLRTRGICWVATDETPRRWAAAAPGGDGALRTLTPTADFLYIRWIGRHGQFDDRSREHLDPAPRLRWWSQRLLDVLDHNPHIRSVYGFFDNDFAGHAPLTCRRLMTMIGLAPPPSTAAAEETTLFG